MGSQYNGAYYDDKELTLSQPITHSRIGYQSVVTKDNVTVSSAEAGYPGESLGNPLTYESWRPSELPATIDVDAGSSVMVDYVGMAVHNLSGCLVTVSYSQDGSEYAEIATAEIVNQRAIMLLFEPVMGRFFRIEIAGYAGLPSLSLDFGNQIYQEAESTGAGGAEVSVLYIGQALAMQRPVYGGVAPSVLSRRTSIVPSRSEGGQWLGRSVIRNGVTASVQWRHLTAAWYRENFDPFVEVARYRPFFLAWRPGGYADEVSYVWTKDDIRPSNMGIRDLMEVTVSAEGLTDE